MQEWILNTTINERFRAFYLGFHSVCASNALIMLRPEEVEQVRERSLGTDKGHLNLPNLNNKTIT